MNLTFHKIIWDKSQVNEGLSPGLMVTNLMMKEVWVLGKPVVLWALAWALGKVVVLQMLMMWVLGKPVVR